MGLLVCFLPLLLALASARSVSADTSIPSPAFQRTTSSVRSALVRREAQPTATELRLRGGGATLSRLLPILLGKKQCRILMLGLDSAGKTTILYQLKLGEMTNTAPTLGFNVETVAYKNIEFMVWDMGGQDAIRQLWSHYFKNAQALIFVVDSADEERLAEARDELHKLMGEEELKDSVLLVFANKQAQRPPQLTSLVSATALQCSPHQTLLPSPPILAPPRPALPVALAAQTRPRQTCG